MATKKRTKGTKVKVAAKKVTAKKTQKPSVSAKSKTHYPELFQPIKIGNCEIKNRIAMAPMNTLFSMDNQGYVTEQCMAYYAARAQGGVGLIITECVFGTRMGAKFPYTTNLHCFNTTHVPGLSETVDTIHAYGAKTFIQLSIGFGRQGHSPTHEHPPAPSPIPYQTDPTLMPQGFIKFLSKNPHVLDPRIPTMAHADQPREMTVGEIKSEIKEYANSCIFALMAGFDGIEIHAPHGYLEHQFLSPRSNKRTDEYGGSLENRMRFVTEVYDAVREKIGYGIPVGIRLSGDEHMPDGIKHEDMKRVVKIMGEKRIDYVHLSSGSYEALKFFFPDEDGTMRQEAAGFKSVLPKHIPVMVPSIHDPAMAVDAIKKGQTDMISLGRQMFADPEWANKVMKGEKFTKCIRCCECLMRTAAALPVRCRLNPECGWERYNPNFTKPYRKRGQTVVPVPPQFIME